MVYTFNVSKMLIQNRFHRLEDILIIRKSNSFNNIAFNRHQESTIKQNGNFQSNQVEALKPVNLSLHKNSTGFYLKKDTYSDFKLPNISKKSNDGSKKTRLKEIEKDFWADTFKNQKIKSFLPTIKPIHHHTKNNDPYQEYKKLIKERNLKLINENDFRYEAFMKI
ncbi:hypothetical protein BpHYR1_048889 [Brachionus plicatilis]|uniref:Uncharacterized protein n=1 Tax=Brachionus plicatilis TaxID=10195 RepID=A0A3M7SSA2_BRAPC|nr:hypothetical protein BpHYR1_048889 [Brachionus plicatilis]